METKLVDAKKCFFSFANLALPAWCVRGKFKNLQRLKVSYYEGCTAGAATYRVFFLTGPPNFQYQNEKEVAANQD